MAGRARPAASRALASELLRDLRLLDRCIAAVERQGPTRVRATTPLERYRPVPATILPSSARRAPMRWIEVTTADTMLAIPGRGRRDSQDGSSPSCCHSSHLEWRPTPLRETDGYCRQPRTRSSISCDVGGMRSETAAPRRLTGAVASKSDSR